MGIARDAPRAYVLVMAKGTRKKTHIPAATRRNVLARDARFTCVYCITGRPSRRSKRVVITLDHVVSEARKGKTIETNLVKACKRCNDDKHTMHLDLWTMQLERDTGLKASDTQQRVLAQQFAPIPSDD